MTKELNLVSHFYITLLIVNGHAACCTYILNNLRSHQYCIIMKKLKYKKGRNTHILST